MSRRDAGKGPKRVGEPHLDLVLDPGDRLALHSGWWRCVEPISDAITANR